MDIQDVIDKIAKQIKGDWIDVCNYLEKFGFEGLDLSEAEKKQLRAYSMLRQDVPYEVADEYREAQAQDKAQKIQEER